MLCQLTLTGNHFVKTTFPPIRVLVLSYLRFLAFGLVPLLFRLRQPVTSRVRLPGIPHCFHCTVSKYLRGSFKLCYDGGLYLQ